MNAPRQLSENELQQLFCKATEKHQNGFLDEACTCYLQLLEYFPNFPILHYNLGLVFYDQGGFSKAMEAFAEAISLDPDDMDILFNYALCQKKQGDLDGAAASFERVLQDDSESLDALYSLAGCFSELKQYEKARDVYLELLQHAPDHLSANNNLAYIYHLTGKREKAVFYYRKVLEYNPGHNSAKHMLAALSGKSATSSPDSYVTEVFDNYSENYEHSLVVELEYCVPSTIRTLLDRCPQGGARYDHGLDLGCGTGLGGRAFADLVKRLDGLDLSEKMLARAAEKNIYNHLYHASIIDFLESTKQRFDFYLAADVFAYVGDLEHSLMLLKKRAASEAVFCFSTENFDGSGYRLRENGRFAHSAAYINDLARHTGWAISATESSGLRKENGEWVRGDLWVFCCQH